jgi:hypothetical protein
MNIRMLHKFIGFAAWGLLAFIAYATISPIQDRPRLPTSTSSSSSSARPRWSRAGSSLSYTPAEVRAPTPVRENVEKQASLDLRDVFLCHAWDDRQGAAKELHDLLESRGVRVWFSEKDVGLGVPLLRAIDKGLANSRIGIVLVTPALLRRLPTEGIADKELSAPRRARRQLRPRALGRNQRPLQAQQHPVQCDGREDPRRGPLVRL